MTSANSGQGLVAEINAMLPEGAPRISIGTELHVAQLRLLAFIAQQVAAFAGVRVDPQDFIRTETWVRGGWSVDFDVEYDETVLMSVELLHRLLAEQGFQRTEADQ